MNNAIAHARYILALASGEMTDEIRGLFLDSIEDGDEQAVFTELMEVYSKRVVEGSDAQTELASLEAEYAALGLMDTLGAYSTYEPVITAAISTTANKMAPPAPRAAFPSRINAAAAPRTMIMAMIAA